MFEDLKRAVTRTERTNLDALYKLATQHWAAGSLTDDQCQHLYEKIEQRRRSIFPARRPRRQKKRTREEILKRNQLASSGPMPSHLAAFFTRCELAALAVIAYGGQGMCDLSVSEIADRALVGRSTVQKAIRLAERLGLVAVEERKVRGNRNQTNVVRIVSREWRTWLERGGSKKLKPLDTRYILSCNSSTSNPSIPVWKRLISRTSPGRLAIQSPPPRCGLVGATNLPASQKVLIR